MLSLILFAAMAVPSPVSLQVIPGQASLDGIEIHGVAAGAFDPAPWQAGTLFTLPDVRQPLLEPRLSGGFRNIYAPSPVETPEGWRLFYGAWDGVDTGNDRIYSVDTADFLDFGERQTEIEHGDFVHVCNVNAHRDAQGGYELVCTAYPDAQGLNKPIYFSSPDGKRWNGQSAPYVARPSDLIRVEGYEKYRDADINGINVLHREGEELYLYFSNFKDFGRVYRARCTEGVTFRFEGPVLDTEHMINDVRRLAARDGAAWYLMGLHANGDRLWYTLSQDPAQFPAEIELARNVGDQDRYIVAIGWVTQGDRVLGAVYGAGAVPELNRNRLFARWLQKRVVFVDASGQRHEATGALGPDRQIIRLPEGGPIEGRFEVYAEDGRTPLGADLPATVQRGQIVQLTVAEPSGGEPVGKDGGVKMMELSGRYGYALQGPYGFAGTLTKESLNAKEWQLEAKFTFGTSGYRVAKVDAVVMESYPEQVRITIPVTPPPPDAMVAQVITEVPVSERIVASDRAVFRIVVKTATE